MKVYDVFSFYNEFDILEIRLKELWDTVDHFVILESNVTYVGNPKEYLFEKNKQRFEPYLEKIRHIKLDVSFEKQKEVFPNEIDDHWTREKYQRYAAKEQLYDIEKDDIIIISDCDEVPRAEMIEMIKSDSNNYDRYLLWAPQFNYKINYMKIYNPSRHGIIMVTRGRAFINPQQEREFSFFWNKKPENTVEVDHGGWHFTYFGNNEHCLNKIRNFAHTEQNDPKIVNKFDIDWMIRNKYGHNGADDVERYEYVKVDGYFPKCIIENLERYKNMIIPDAAFSVWDLYRPEDRN
jgi:hypothetical protein